MGLHNLMDWNKSKPLMPRENVQKVSSVTDEFFNVTYAHLITTRTKMSTSWGCLLGIHTLGAL